MELLVVVLTLGILMAIVVPTFLSVTSSARAVGAEANLHAAGTDEVGYFTQHGIYATTSTSPSVSQIDGGLNWATCTGNRHCIADAGGRKDVYVLTVTDGAYPAVVLGSAGTTGENYWMMESQNPATVTPEYEVTTSATPPLVSDFNSAAHLTWKQAGG